MKHLLFLVMFLHVGCATKYIIPGNRFMTPESQGGVFRGQFEFQQTSATQLTADVSDGTVENGVQAEDVKRSGFLFSTSILDQFDFFWNHTGGANSMIGGKFQFMGGSRTANATGHKMALSVALGGNEHEVDDEPAVNFELSGREFQFLYGYRFSEMILTYANLSYSTYDFTGEISSSDATIDGLAPEYETTTRSLYGGLEFDFGAFMAKIECGYQQILTTDTKDRSAFLFGYSLGLNW